MPTLLPSLSFSGPKIIQQLGHSIASKHTKIPLKTISNPFCSIAWHVSGGLYVNILERPADVSKLTFPADSANTCKTWGAWTNTHVVDEIDSGLRIK